MGPGSGILHFVQNDNLAEPLALADSDVSALPYFQAATSLDCPPLTRASFVRKETLAGCTPWFQFHIAVEFLSAHNLQVWIEA
jgi:hypothetical protein